MSNERNDMFQKPVIDAEEYKRRNDASAVQLRRNKRSALANSKRFREKPSEIKYNPRALFDIFPQLEDISQRARCEFIRE